MIRAAASEDCYFDFGTNINYFKQFSQPILHCLNFIKKYFMLMCNKKEELCTYILNQMKRLLLFIGRLSQFDRKFQEFSFYRKSDQENALYHHFHLTLQIWWTFIEMCFMRKSLKNNQRLLTEINLIICDGTSDNNDLFFQSVRILFYDLLSFSVLRFNDIYKNNYENLTSPFVCTCFMEIIIMLKIILSFSLNNNEFNNFEQFYSILFDLIENFDPKKSNQTFTLNNEIQIEHFKSIWMEKYTADNYNQYLLWIWSNIVPLLRIFPDSQKLSDYSYSHNISVPLPSTIVKIYRIMIKELEIEFPYAKSNSFNEKYRLVSSLLLSAIRISRFISEESFKIALILTDFILKRLNFNFINSNANMIEDFIVVKNGHKWSENVSEIIATKNYNYSDIFKLFLFYTYNQLKNLVIINDQKRNQSSNQVFQKIISQVLVTLQPPILRSLKLNGFYKMGLYYLTLIKSIPINYWIEFNDRLLNIIKELIKEKRNADFLEMIMKFLFAIFHIQKKFCFEDRKISSIINKIINNNVLKNFVLINQKKEYLSLINCYFNELNSLLEQNSFDGINGPIILYYIDDLIIKIHLIPLFRQIHLFNSNHSDCTKIGEFFNNLLNEIYQTIAPSFLNNDQYSSDQQLITTTVHNSNNDLDNLSNCNLLNILYSNLPLIIDLMMEFIKEEIQYKKNSEDVFASIALKITLINFIR